MRVNEARLLVARAVDFGLIDRNEASRRHTNISRVARNPRRVQIWVDDLIDPLEQIDRIGQVVTILQEDED